MHYKNGREAKPGDKVIAINPAWPGCNKVGIVHSFTPGAATCNAAFSPLTNCESVTLGECLHIDDIAKAEIPDSSKV